MAKKNTIKGYRSNVTGEIAPAHQIGWHAPENEQPGTEATASRVFQNPGPEWGPINADGEECAFDYDSDGNWIEIP
jgi:hypothetical protein